MEEQLTLPPFAVTRAAIERIAELGGAVQIDVEPGGCSGLVFVYRAADPDPPEASFARFGCLGAWLWVSARAAPHLVGATLDHSSSIRPPRFRVLRNPSTPLVCPCKRSFGDPWPGPGQSSCRSYQPMPWDQTYEPPARWRRQTGWEP